MGGEIPPMNNKKKGFYYMGKIYFIADTKIGEESMTTAPLYVITDDNNNRLFTDILEITDVRKLYHIHCIKWWKMNMDHMEKPL